MEYRPLGRSGLKVSVLCLGTMTIGGRTDERTAARMFASLRESGVNFIDTADAYMEGRSEEIIGRLTRRDRDRWVIATKVGYTHDPAPRIGRLSRKWMMRSIDGSLTRLGTDYVDIWYLHKHDPNTPLGESVTAVGDAIAQGKVRYWGFSNYRGWQIGELIGLADALGLPRPVVSQPYYNAMNRMPETDYLPACEYYGVGAVPYSPLARGVLTGKYRPGAKPPSGSRAVTGYDPRMLETEYREESLLLVQRIKDHAAARGMTAGQFALRWVLNSRNVASVVAGPRNLAQWRSYLGALDHRFTAADEALIDAMVPAGHPSTPGYTDPLYPVTGRAPRIA